MSTEDPLMRTLQSEGTELRIGEGFRRNAIVYWDTRDGIWWVTRRLYKEEVEDHQQAEWYEDLDTALMMAERWCDG